MTQSIRYFIYFIVFAALFSFRFTLDRGEPFIVGGAGSLYFRTVQVLDRGCLYPAQHLDPEFRFYPFQTVDGSGRLGEGCGRDRNDLFPFLAALAYGLVGEGAPLHLPLVFLFLSLLVLDRLLMAGGVDGSLILFAGLFLFALSPPGLGALEFSSSGFYSFIIAFGLVSLNGGLAKGLLPHASRSPFPWSDGFPRLPFASGIILAFPAIFRPETFLLWPVLVSLLPIVFWKSRGVLSVIVAFLMGVFPGLVFSILAIVFLESGNGVVGWDGVWNLIFHWLLGPYQVLSDPLALSSGPLHLFLQFVYQNPLLILAPLLLVFALLKKGDGTGRLFLLAGILLLTLFSLIPNPGSIGGESAWLAGLFPLVMGMAFSLQGFASGLKGRFRFFFPALLILAGLFQAGSHVQRSVHQLTEKAAFYHSVQSEFKKAGYHGGVVHTGGASVEWIGDSYLKQQHTLAPDQKRFRELERRFVKSRIDSFVLVQELSESQVPLAYRSRYFRPGKGTILNHFRFTVYTRRNTR